MRPTLPGSLAGLSALLVIPCVVFAAGTFLPRIPYVGAVGSFVFPPLAAQFLLVSVIGAACALLAMRRGARTAGLALAVTGASCAVAAAAVLAAHGRVASANGVSVDLRAAFLVRLSSAAPDETVTYTRSGTRELRMDVYRPASVRGGPAPVLFYVHGGGWIQGTPRGQAATLRWFAERGYVVFSAEYVLATPGMPTWNTAGPQIACALGWIQANAVKYGGDVTRLFAYGESAGGALVLTATYAAAAGQASSSCGGTIPAVRAVAAEYPAVDPFTLYDNADPLMGPSSREMVTAYLGASPHEVPDRARFVSPANYIHANAPPTLIFLPVHDHLVPVAGALDFVSRASQAGVPLRTVHFPLADHTLNLQYYSVANQVMQRVMLQHFCRHGGACQRRAAIY